MLRHSAKSTGSGQTTANIAQQSIQWVSQMMHTQKYFSGVRLPSFTFFRLSTASCEQASSHRKLTEEDQEKFDQMSMDAFELTCKFASVCLVGRTPESIQTDLKERWADAGAELLVGAHTGEDEDEAAQVSPSFHIF